MHIVAHLAGLAREGKRFPKVEGELDRVGFERFLAAEGFWTGEFLLGDYARLTCTTCNTSVYVPCTRRGLSVVHWLKREHVHNCCPERIERFGGEPSIWPDEDGGF